MKWRSALAYCLLSSTALAQSAPNWPNGYTPSATEWNNQWASKLNTTNPVASGTFTLGGVAVTGFGTSIGQALGPLISSGGGNLPMLSTSNRLIFRRANPAVNDSTDFQFDRITTFTGGTTSGNLNRLVGVNVTMGPGDGTTTYGVLANATQASTSAGALVPIWGQNTRQPGSNGWIWGGIFGAIDLTGLSSAAAGVPNQAGTEVDMLQSGADDATNAGTFGGFGVRKAIHVVMTRAAAGDPLTEISTGLWFGSGQPGVFGPSTADALMVVNQAVGFTPGTAVRNGIDTRGAITPSGSTNPVSTVTMSAGHVIDYNGGTTLSSAPRNYWWYDTGTSKMKYNVSGTTVMSIDNSGNIRALGTVTGSVTP